MIIYNRTSITQNPCLIFKPNLQTIKGSPLKGKIQHIKKYIFFRCDVAEEASDPELDGEWVQNK
jgi:hypothetical protein